MFRGTVQSDDIAYYLQMFCLTAHFSLTPRSAMYFTSKAKHSLTAVVAFRGISNMEEVLVETVRTGECLLILNFT